MGPDSQLLFLQPGEWTALVSRLPARRHNLRGPAGEHRLRALERSLGHHLPPGFRSFLRAWDGGYLGRERILGTPELSMLPPGDLLERGLLPFHPVGPGFDCLDLKAAGRGPRWREAPVLWWHPSQKLHKTHEDFTDWVLDQLHELAD